MERRKVRNAVSDEMRLDMGMITGHLGRGDYYIRKEGRLVRITVADKYPFDRQDLGSENIPENLALYYRNLKDATLKERLTMVVGKVINLAEYITAMVNDGWWNRQKFMENYKPRVV